MKFRMVKFKMKILKKENQQPKKEILWFLLSRLVKEVQL